jgi:hypothetical protein
MSRTSTIGCVQNDIRAYGTFGANHAPTLCCDYHYLQTDPHHPSGAPKKISLHVVHSAQTVHLSFVEINTLSKQTQISFHLTHITEEFDRVHPKRSPSLLHVRRKSCTYLALRLTLSQKVISKSMIHSARTVHHLTLRLTHL